jgi:serine/threonine protein kinase
LISSKKRSTFCGTFEYMAPEMFENEEYSFSVDIWGLGILLYELFHRRSPYEEKNAFKIYRNIL